MDLDDDELESTRKMKGLTPMTLKERFEKAERLEFNSQIEKFDYIYFKSTRRKHDSGYYMFEVYGEIGKKMYKLSSCSDVIDFEQNQSFRFDWFATIDIPEPGVFRIFSRTEGGLICPYKFLSSFLIRL